VPGGIHHSVVLVRDLDASLRSYRDGISLDLLLDRQVEGDWLLCAPRRRVRGGGGQYERGGPAELGGFAVAASRDVLGQAGTHLQGDGQPRVAENDLRVASRNTEVLEQGRGRVPQVMDLDRPDLVAPQIRWNERTRLRGSTGRPVLVVKTSPLSSHARPSSGVRSARSFRTHLAPAAPQLRDSVPDLRAQL